MSFSPFSFMNNKPIELVYPSDTSGCKNVLLIDNTVKDAQLFANSVNADTFPIIYSGASTKPELSVLLKTTFPNSVIERIGLVFISDGVIVKTFLDSKPFFTNDDGEHSVSPYSENVDFIISVIKEFNVNNIDYLACDTLNYPNWKNYYTILTKETGVTVGASNDKTGNIKYGGDWVMESTSQNIELIYFTKSIEYYSYLLDQAGYHTIVLKLDGTIWGTGYNNVGQLGTGNYTNVNVLTQMNTNNINGSTPKYISCAFATTIVLMTDGTIYGTGRNEEGQLGTDDTDNRSLLTIMNTNNINGNIPKYISCGCFHTIVLMTDGTIYGTGYNGYGQLGTGNTDNRSLLTIMNTNNINGNIPKYISCGSNHTIVLMTDGTIWGTGRNVEGQLGIALNDTTTRTILTEMTIPSGKTAKYIACGEAHTIVLMTDGTIYGTGYNLYGQLGFVSGDPYKVTSLTEMTIPISKIPKYISCGWEYTIVLMTDGTIYGTGRNVEGQLGTGNNTSVTSLTAMNIPNSKIPKYISCGSGHTIVLMTDGTIYGTGNNEFGQSGTNDTSNRLSLTKMAGDNNTNITYIADMMMPVDIISDICFPAGTPIQTDQGIIEIDKINPYIHTINNKSIVDVTKSVTADKYLVEFKKNALALNYPTENTLMSQKHNVFYNGKMREAKTFLDEFENVVKVKYNGETLYNILMEEHSHMSVNNLICDTLNPDSLFAKFYTKKCKYPDDVRDNLVGSLMNAFTNKDYKTYSNLLKSC